MLTVMLCITCRNRFLISKNTDKIISPGRWFIITNDIFFSRFGVMTILLCVSILFVQCSVNVCLDFSTDHLITWIMFVFVNFAYSIVVIGDGRVKWTLAIVSFILDLDTDCVNSIMVFSSMRYKVLLHVLVLSKCVAFW